MTNAIETRSSETVTQTFGTARGVRFEITTHGRIGRVEIYQEYSDAPGLFEFLGFADEILPRMPAVWARDLAELLEAHASAYAAFWGAYLPGASRWMAA